MSEVDAERYFGDWGEEPVSKDEVSRVVFAAEETAEAAEEDSEEEEDSGCGKDYLLREL